MSQIIRQPFSSCSTGAKSHEKMDVPKEAAQCLNQEWGSQAICELVADNGGYTKASKQRFVAPFTSSMTSV